MSTRSKCRAILVIKVDECHILDDQTSRETGPDAMFSADLLVGCLYLEATHGGQLRMSDDERILNSGSTPRRVFGCCIDVLDASYVTIQRNKIDESNEEKFECQPIIKKRNLRY